MHRSWGGIVAGVLFVLPSMFILMALTWIYLVYGKVRWWRHPLRHQAAVTAIVLFAAYRIGSRALKNGVLWAISAAAFVAFSRSGSLSLHRAGGSIIGAVGGRVAPSRFATAAARRSGQGLWRGDHRRRHAHARARALHLAAPHRLHRRRPRPLGGAMAWLYAAQGWDGTLTQIGWFFTKAALLTFGGAYAVLPYVYQGGVETYGWLTPTQMIDGLALGETTQGADHDRDLCRFRRRLDQTTVRADAAALIWAGIAGGAVATFFTFLPSYLFILIGGPLVEATHGDLKFTAPLTGITAAVVGVILNLAVFFAWHVLWPAGFGGGFEWFAALAGLAHSSPCPGTKPASSR